MASWIPVPAESDFSLDNLPFGIFSSRRKNKPSRRPGVAIGDHVIDLSTLSADGRFQELTGLGAAAPAVFSRPTLNEFAALGKDSHHRVRKALRSMLVAEPAEDYAFFRDTPELREQAVVHRDDVVMHLPMEIGDFTDFYTGTHHARNVGSLFRDPKTPLPANFATLPIAYHGRASSVVVSGSPVQRPWGQIIVSPAAGGDAHVMVGPSRSVDFELELGCFICKPNDMGVPIKTSDAYNHIFGFVLLNDWSARDIQRYEYVPLGPFSGKNFATSISPWVVLAEALDPFYAPIQMPPARVFPYLEGAPSTMFDLRLEVDIQLPGEAPANITKTSSNNLKWSFPQMVAQHTLCGCPLRAGDLFGTGTISGASPDMEYGSLLELSKNGKEAFSIGISSKRTWLQDSDTVILKGYAIHPTTGARVGFGECTGTIQPARPLN